MCFGHDQHGMKQIVLNERKQRVCREERTEGLERYKY